MREALVRNSSRVDKVLVQKDSRGSHISDIRRLASKAGVEVQYVPERRLSQIAGGLNHQGVVAIATPIGYVDLHEMLESIAPSRADVTDGKPRILILDGIQDPFNFGGILRSAVASGTNGIIVPERDMAPLNAAALKASAGTASRVPIARVTNVADVIYELKERGYWVVGASADGETSVWEMDWNRAIALVIGSEGAGIRRRVKEACDYRIYIPMDGPAESLNASVAAGILLFAAAKEAKARERPG